MLTQKSFTQKCFMQNTPEIIGYLEWLGIEKGYIDKNDKFIGVFSTENENYFASFNENKSITKDYIDCGENIKLFISISALRSDSDDKQIFIDCEGNFVLHTNADNNRRPINKLIRKATVEELIKHFSK
jgi:hypothetical protein